MKLVKFLICCHAAIWNVDIWRISLCCLARYLPRLRAYWKHFALCLAFGKACYHLSVLSAVILWSGNPSMLGQLIHAFFKKKSSSEARRRGWMLPTISHLSKVLLFEPYFCILSLTPLCPIHPSMLIVNECLCLLYLSSKFTSWGIIWI